MQKCDFRSVIPLGDWLLVNVSSLTYPEKNIYCHIWISFTFKELQIMILGCNRTATLDILNNRVRNLK